MGLAPPSFCWLSSLRLTGCIILLGLPFAGLSGCGTGEAKSATAKGKVTNAGQPVTEGVVHFASAAGYGGSSTLDASGGYKITQGMPPGTYNVCVMPPSLTMTGAPGGPPPPPAKEYANIPEKFRSDMTSGLAATVKAGENTFDFKLD